MVRLFCPYGVEHCPCPTDTRLAFFPYTWYNCRNPVTDEQMTREVIDLNLKKGLLLASF